MRSYKVIVEYVREGKTYREPWFSMAENGDDAIEFVEEHFHKLNDHIFAGAKDATFSVEKVVETPEIHKREESDTPVSIGHPNLVAHVAGYAREVETEDGKSGILIFIPTGVGKSLLEIIKVD